MDVKTNNLLYELNWDCRQSYTKLGKKLNMSKQVIAYRVNQLEKEKTILGYHALIDWRRLGFNSVRVYLKFHNITPSKEQEIYELIKKNPFFIRFKSI